MTDDWGMMLNPIHALPLFLAMAVSEAMGANLESPASGPHKSPLEWPTFWSREIVGHKPNSQSHAAHGNALAKLTLASAGPDLSDPRTQRFTSRLGMLTPVTVIAAMDSKTHDDKPAVLAMDSEPIYQHFIKADLLAHAPSLSPLQSGQWRQGESKISYHASNQSEILQPYDRLTLGKGQDDGLKVGDLYQLYEVGPLGYAYSSSRGIGHQIIPNGVAEIVAVKPRSATARLVSCFGKISRDTRASPLLPEENRFPVSGYAPISGEKPKGRVVWVPGSGQLPQPFNFAIIDQGVEGGFRLGDHVLLMNQKGGKMTDRLLGEGLIVHVESTSATLMVHDVFPGIINTGDFALAVQTPQQ